MGADTTFVEGHIHEDITWTLAGSPYVITNDVIIDRGSTLTINPGVEVRFDGNFTLTVNGSLSAMGDEDSLITFTSNKLDPSAGDWNTIEFTATTDESLIMKHSVVKYATYGLTVKNTCKAIIEKSQVTDVSRSGIYVVGESNTLIKDNTIKVYDYGIRAEGEISSGMIIANNYILSSHNHGIYISGQPPESQIRNVTISGNTILSKMDGIRLHAHYQFDNSRIHSVKISDNTLQCTENGIYLYAYSWWDAYIYQVTISSNIILLNKFGNGIHLCTDSMWNKYVYNIVVSNNKVSNATNGIHISAGKHTEGVQYDVTIVGNRVSDSKKGICVFGAYTLVGINSNITANSICYNTLGISYDTHAHNSAHYNHVYRNSHGMTISNGATVNATYNYWGDETGPYHATSNPTGKGNSVNGNGTDLDFRPFLSTPISSLNEPPVAVLQTDRTRVTTNQSVKFNATASSDDSRIDEYFFDFGDGTNSSWTTLSTIEHNYSRSGIYNAGLSVMDDLGFMSNNTAIKTITVIPLLTVSLTLDPTTIHSGEEALVKVHVTCETIAVEGALVQITSNSGGNFTYTSNITDINGDLIAIFTVSNISVQASIKITATASKSGYHDGFDYEYITVLPPEKRWFDETLIWISVVAMIVVIAGVLIWKKVRFRRAHAPQISE